MTSRLDVGRLKRARRAIAKLRRTIVPDLRTMQECVIGDAALYVIYRLASCVLVCCYPANLGDVLVRGEWLLVVLGDVLTATDAGRLARGMGVLEGAAQRLPVVILTCYPERYRSLAGAHFVDLEAIVREAS